VFRGSCLCGAVAFEAESPSEFATVTVRVAGNRAAPPSLRTCLYSPEIFGGCAVWTK
jgi:hypothetical protein